MVNTVRVVLLIFGLLASIFLYTIIFAIVSMTITGTKAMGLPALLYNPPYWLLMILILGGEAWLAVHKVRW